MSEQHTPPEWALDAAREINSIVDEQEFDYDLIIRVASVVADATYSAVIAEREACAQIAQSMSTEHLKGKNYQYYATACESIAAAIRARAEAK